MSDCGHVGLSCTHYHFHFSNAAVIKFNVAIKNWNVSSTHFVIKQNFKDLNSFSKMPSLVCCSPETNHLSPLMTISFRKYKWHNLTHKCRYSFVTRTSCHICIRTWGIIAHNCIDLYLFVWVQKHYIQDVVQEIITDVESLYSVRLEVTARM